MASLSKLHSSMPHLHRHNVTLLKQSSINTKLNSHFKFNSSNSTDFHCCGVKQSSNKISVADDDNRTLIVSSKTSESGKVVRVGLICGGPSPERGISLNSARSLLDHIQGDDLQVSCYYVDCQLKAYSISPAQLYSNTPADFDFKIESLAQGFHSLSDFAEHLATSVDMVFPVIHGPFCEDGTFQELLERSNVPYGSESIETDLIKWFERNALDINAGKVVVKPARGGSSIGVTVAYGVSDSLRKANQIISEGIDDRALVEVFLEGGREFTAIVLDVGTGSDCNPVVLLPTEVELQYLGEKDAIFNFRRKYLPTQQVAYHTPPRFPIDVIEFIRKGTSLLFQRLRLHDFARIDGWYLPPSSQIPSSSEEFGRTESGIVLFTDINLISGMEQTSFLFQQASKVGFSHSNILRTILQLACSRFPSLSFHSDESHTLFGIREHSKIKAPITQRDGARKVFVIFGGDTSERQVSLMSGTNVWLNLQAFDDLDVTPCLLAPTSSSYIEKTKEVDLNSTSVWSLLAEAYYRGSASSLYGGTGTKLSRADISLAETGDE